MIVLYHLRLYYLIFQTLEVLCVNVMTRKLIVPSAADIAKKWTEVTPARATYYEAETPKAADIWEANTKAAKGTYKAGISVARIAERFEGGVSRAGAAKFRRKVEAVGIDRFGPGVAAAEVDMKDGVGPYRDVLDGLDVPDRRPRGDPANLKIVEKIFKELHAKRMAVLGATAGGV